MSVTTMKDTLDSEQGLALATVPELLKKKRRMTRDKRERVKARALQDYLRGDRLKDIAIRYGTSTTAISLWAKAAHLPRRVQGCRYKGWPDKEDYAIVMAVKAVRNGSPTLEEIGRRFGNKSRAGIHRIWAKWKNWVPRMPYKKGDRIRIRDRDYIVIEPGVFEGEIEDVKTQERSKRAWKCKVDRANKWEAVKIES